MLATHLDMTARCLGQVLLWRLSPMSATSISKHFNTVGIRHAEERLSFFYCMSETLKMLKVLAEQAYANE